MPGDDEARESEDVRLPPSPLKTAMKWLGVVSALGGLVGYGIWIGTIQHRIDTIETDVGDNENAIKSHEKSLQAAESRERDRFDQLIKALRIEFNEEKDELWELKSAIGLVQLEMRWRHGERSDPPPAVATMAGESAPLMPPGADPGHLRPTSIKSTPVRPASRPTRRDIDKIAERADEAMEDIAEAKTSDPLSRLSF